MTWWQIVWPLVQAVGMIEALHILLFQIPFRISHRETSTMATASDCPATAAPAADLPMNWKTRLVDGGMKYLMGQEAVVVLLFLILIGIGFGLVGLYNGFRTDSKEQREAHAAQMTALQASYERREEKFNEGFKSVATSLDRLADELRASRK